MSIATLTGNRPYRENGTCVMPRTFSEDGRLMSFGKNLQALRETAGLSQSELAEKSGISVKTIQNWEIDRNTPRMDALVRLAKALGTTLDRLVIHRYRRQAKTKRRRGRPRKEK